MAIFKCKMCGGALEINGGDTVIECEYCGTKQTLPKLDDEKRANMYDRANHFRRNNEFDKAMGIYEQILNEDNTDAEAYWSLVLCRYGIEYVEDPATKKRVPTVNRAQFTSIFDDEDYKSALSNADSLQKAIYEAEATAINEIQKGILAISQKEEPFDVFICYKETDETGRRTPDSVLANDLYHQLTGEGFKVFFSRITLEDKLGQEYEPYIFAALNSAKVMVVLGTKPEYFKAVWVKNEWSRYLALIKNGAKKILIPAYKDMDPYDLPDEFSHLQAQDMSKLGFMQDLIRGIKKITEADEPKATIVKETVVTESASANIAPLLKRMFMFLEDGEWNSANEYAEKVLDIEPECAEAYLGKLMAELNVRKKECLKDCSNPFDSTPNYNKAMRFGDDALKAELSGYVNEWNKGVGLEREKKASIIKKYNSSNAKTISAGSVHTVGLKSDGTAIAIGDNRYGQCIVDSWNDIVEVSAGDYHAVGLKSDGTVVAVGKTNEGQCNVKTWNDIVSVSAGGYHTVGLKDDGTVISTKYIGDKKCDYGQYDVFDWTDIVAVVAGNGHTVGVKSNGTVVAVGNNKYSQCEVSGWKEIKAIAVGYNHTIGLKLDGTVIAVGNNEYGQCNIESWKDVVAISAGYGHTVGLKSDGTVVAVGANNYGNCDVDLWRNIVAISAGSWHTIGLKSDGTAVAVGNHNYGRRNVEGWEGVAIPIAADNYQDYIVKRKTENKKGEVIFEQKAKEARIEAERKAEEARKEAERKAEEERKEAIYQKANSKMFTNIAFGYRGAIELFESIPGYKDSEAKIEECKKAIAEIEAEQERLRVEAEKKAEEARIEAERIAKRNKKIAIIATPIVCAILAFVVLLSTVIIPNKKYNEAVSLMDAGKYAEATVAFEALGDYKDSAEKIKECNYNFAVSLMDAGKYAEAIPLFYESIKIKDARELFNKATDEARKLYGGIISAGDAHTVGLKADGTVVAMGDNDFGKCGVTDWSDIIAVSAGGTHTVGLKADGTVVAVGYNDDGQCDVSDWSDIIAVSAGCYHAVGLKADGTVVAVGWNEYGQCDVSDWSDIIAVSAGYWHTVGLKADGTVVAVGYNDDGQCDVSDWSDIIAVFAGDDHTVGLKADGTVVAVGDNDYGQCNVDDWKDIIAVSAGGRYYTVGLKADGTVVAVGDNDYGQCDVTDWSDIIAVSAGYYHTVGLKADGTVVAVGKNYDGRCDVTDWDLF